MILGRLFWFGWDLHNVYLQTDILEGVFNLSIDQCLCVSVDVRKMQLTCLCMWQYFSMQGNGKVLWIAG